ncbi:hypothetical protein [Nonomuraea mesophila]|nr:hypothetical protein [Nonomuraea mesophila]
MGELTSWWGWLSVVATMRLAAHLAGAGRPTHAILVLQLREAG